MRSSHSVTYLDHSTTAGAFALLDNPQKNLNAFTLLDLMVCAEAFAFYDYYYCFWNGSGLIESKARAVNSELGMQMTDLELKTMRNLDIALSDEFKEYWSSFEYFGCKNLEEKFSSLINELRRRMPGHIYNPDHSYGINDFDSIGGIFHYIFHSTFLGINYSPSSVRIPVVSLLKRQINRKICDEMDSCMSLVNEDQKKKMEFVKTRFYGYEVPIVFPPVFQLVLRECSGPEDFLPTLHNFRNSRIAKKFRKWILKLQKRIHTGEIHELVKVISELNHLKKQFSEGNGNNPQQVLEFIPSGLVGFKKAISDTMSKRSNQAVEMFLHPHAFLLKKLMNSLQTIEKDFELIEKRFKVTISEETLKEFEELRTFDRKLSEQEL